MKLITFSLWDSDPKYCVGAIRNAELVREIYPGWLPRFYVAEDVPASVVKELRQHTDQILDMPEGLEGWKGMLARFLPASEDDVDVMLSRDCDSRLSEREAEAVNEWLESPKLVSSLGDHPYHFNPSQALMGGMFGMKKYACPEMTTLIKQFIHQYSDTWQCDQDFLRDKIWPLVSHKVLAYSDIHPGCQPFPVERQGLEFVGKIFLADETTIIEHEQALQKML